MHPTRLRVLRHESPQAHFELAFAQPDAALRQYVLQYVGWFDRSSLTVCRRELPGGAVPLIINFGVRVRERKANGDTWNSYGTFAAGLHDAYTLAESAGPGHGLQVNFTPCGAHLFFDRPLRELYNQTVELNDLVGPAADRLSARLYDASSWEERFDLLDREIGSRIRAARQRPPDAIVWASRRLIETAGAMRIGDLVHATSWSERHFASEFAEHVGVTPKVFARVLRFGHAVRLLTSGRAPSLAEVALACGYYDQSHFTRDFRAFAGVPPSSLLESRMPEEAGFRSGE